MTRLLPFALSVVLLAAVAVPAIAPAAAQTATCTSSVGPGIPPPSGISMGLPGFHSRWYGQSGYAQLCPHHQAAFTIALLNTGSLGWHGGVMGQSAYLGTWGPEPGQDHPSVLGGDGARGTPNTGWPRYDRIAVQSQPYIGPGQVAWFRFTLQAPATPGWYRLHLRPLIEGAEWLEDEGIYWEVAVLGADGSVPARPAPLVVSTVETAATASWFGPGLWGNRTACGQILTSELRGVAHRTLPCGSTVTLRYGGATVTVPVVDRGPFIAGREFDLTYATRVDLGCPDICSLSWVR